MTVRVRIEYGQDAGRTWRLAKVGHYVIGRHPESAIRIIDMKVSKEHCRLRVVDAKTLLGDLGSTHGTLLNGQPMSKEKEQELKPGDEIRLGSTVLRVLGDGTADVEADPSSAELPAGLTQAPEPAKNGPVVTAQRKKAFAPDALVGKEVAGYRVIEKIGQGGMGAVYRAEQLSLHREVALKVLSEKFTTDNAFVDQFVNEARAAGALNHPNVVQVYDVGQENGRFFFSMEFVTGGSVEDRLKDNKPADWRDALNWFLDAANALIFAKKRGILHRDVKPDNLMIAENGSAKLCDLGLAKKSESSDLLAQGIIGTPHFISPEAVRRKKDIDARSDLYSLGCTFYRVLTGHNPYPRETVKDILMAQLKDPVPRVSAKNPEVPKDLDEVVFKLMQKEPEQRFQTPEDLLQSLDKIRLQFGLEAHGIKTGVGKKVLGIAAVLVLAAAAVVIYVVTRPPPPHQETAAEKAARLEREAERERLIQENAQKDYVVFREGRNGALRDLDLKRATAGSEESDEFYETLAKEYDRFAEELERHEKYKDRPEVVQMAQDARKAAQELRDFVRIRSTVQKEITEGRQQAETELDEKLKGIVQGFGEALAKKQWVAAEALVTEASIEAAIGPIRDRKVAAVLPPGSSKETLRRFQDQLLLKAELIAGKVKESLGDPPGKAMREQLLAAMQKDFDEKVGKIDEEAKKATIEGYEKALELLDALLGGLPPTPNAEAPEGSVEKQLGTFVSGARTRRDDTLTKLGMLRVEQIRGDARTYWELVRALRQPGAGLLYGFSFAPARLRMEGDGKKMKDAKYQGLVAERLEDVNAIDRFVQRTVESFPRWEVDKVEVADDAGKTRSVKVKSVTAQGMTLGAEEQKWADFDLGWLLDALWFANADAPRFPLDGQDHRALAVLAEMAARFDVAQKHWMAYRTSLPADATRTQEHVMKRLAGFANEQRVAEGFHKEIQLLREVEDFLAMYEALDNQGKFDKEARERCLQEKSGMLQRMQTLQTLLAELESGELAKTTWASAIRPVYPGVDYDY